MSNLPENPSWPEGIYQIEVDDPIQGGVDGIDNRQARQLANRTLWLRQQLEQIASGGTGGTPGSGDGGAAILDTATDTFHTWSARKIGNELAALKNAILNGAPAAFDTLLEIADQLASDKQALATLLDAVGNRVSFLPGQTLTAAQKAQAISNIGALSADDVGDLSINFVLTFENALI
jgi:hypothetical protein